MALKLSAYNHQTWPEVQRWLGTDHPPPPHCVCAAEDGALVAVLTYHLADGQLLLVSGVQVHPALGEADKGEAQRYVCRATMQLGKMLGRFVVTMGPPLEVKKRPQKPGVANGGGTTTNGRVSDVTQASGESKEEEIEW